MPGQRERWGWIGLGLALATGTTLVLEIALTRIFSVILWYHYGFMSISLALLGIGIAGVAVYLYPERFPRDQTARLTAGAALLFAATTVAALLAFHWIVSVPSHWPLETGWRTVIFLIITIPFFFAGLAVALPISRYTERVGILYAADLVGAAVGAAAVIPLMAWLGGLYVLLACAVLACLAATCFAVAAGRSRTVILGIAGALVAAIGLGAAVSTDFFRIRYSKFGGEGMIAAEQWNSFSRVVVQWPVSERPFAWALGRDAPDVTPGYRLIVIDGGAGTPMLEFDGDVSSLGYLGFDMSSLGYHVRPPRTALVIGSGGGRDILTSKLFGVEEVHAVEVNPLVAGYVRGEFRDYSNSPYDLPGVSFTIEDGRSFAARSRRSFDFITVSAVDTTAALAAGALSLVEDSLYTVEAFEDYYDRLSEVGLLSVTRNWTVESQPMGLRAADMVRRAWSNRDVARPQDHLILVAPAPGARQRWGTLLASKQPFQPAEVARVREVVAQRGFSILYAPDTDDNPEAFQDLFGSDPEAFFDAYPRDVRATTDDRPFFFFLMKPFHEAEGKKRYVGTDDMFWGSRKTPEILAQLFALVSGLVLIFAFVVPGLVGRLKLGATRGAGWNLLYFAGIGLGFILVELSLIQRYTVVLGQPVFAFAAILGCILVFSGIGSFGSHRIAPHHVARAALTVLALVVLVVAVHAFAVPPLLASAMHLELPARLLITIATLAPLGLMMGLPLPLGMRLLEARAPQALAWGWGVNGSLSVVGTVLAMVISILFGITATMLAGAAMYALSLACVRR